MSFLVPCIIVLLMNRWRHCFKANKVILTREDLVHYFSYQRMFQLQNLVMQPVNVNPGRILPGFDRK